MCKQISRLHSLERGGVLRHFLAVDDRSATRLRDGIYELRVELGHVNYRILYFFHQRLAAVILHGITKEDKVPAKEIEKAIARKRKFEADPGRHTHVEE